MADSQELDLLKRITKVNHSIDRMVSERQLVNENITNARKRLRKILSEADQVASGQTDMFRQSAAASTNGESSYCPCGGRTKNGKQVRCTRIADVKYHAEDCEIGAAVGSADSAKTSIKARRKSIADMTSSVARETKGKAKV